MKTDKEVIVIDGVRYRRVDDTKSEHAIVVCDRGFVLYGLVERDGHNVIIDNCGCIRRWGTKEGLGELAFGGPTDKTIIDWQPTTMVHELQVVQCITCLGKPWKQ